MLYQQQALALREEFLDTRGISESCFQIGVIYERWQQCKCSQAYYARASQFAEQYNHPFEKPSQSAIVHSLHYNKDN